MSSNEALPTNPTSPEATGDNAGNGESIATNEPDNVANQASDNEQNPDKEAQSPNGAKSIENEVVYVDKDGNEVWLLNADLTNMPWQARYEHGGEKGVEDLKRKQSELQRQHEAKKAKEAERQSRLEEGRRRHEQQQAELEEMRSRREQRDKAREAAQVQARLEYGANDMYAKERQAFVDEKMAEYDQPVSVDGSDSQGEQPAPASAQPDSAENEPVKAADTAGSKQAGSKERVDKVDKNTDQPLSERQRQFNEQIEQEGMLRMLRKELHDQLSQEGIADPDQQQQAAEAFLDDRFRDEVDAGLMNANMRKWVGKLLAANEEQFNKAINDKQDLHEKAELYTDTEKKGSNLLLNWATRIKNRKDRFKEGLKGEENRRKRIVAYGLGSLAVLGTTGMTLYVSYKTGMSAGFEEGIAEGLAEGQEQIEAQESIIDRQDDVIERQQDIIEGLEGGEAGPELDGGSGASPEVSEEASSLYGELAGEKVSFTIPENGNVWNELEAVVDAKTSPETSPSEKQRLVGNMLEALEQENPGRDLDLVYPNEEFSITLPK